MLVTSDVRVVVEVLFGGGVIAYPTEGVWGLGCNPFDQLAVQRVLTIKGRSVNKGLILLITELEMLNGLVADLSLVETKINERKTLEKISGPITWLLPALPQTQVWLTGGTGCIAVRQTEHSLVRRLVSEFGAPLVSTSANVSGEAAVTRMEQLSPAITGGIDLVLSGQVGTLAKPTPIYDLVNEVWVRK